MYQRIYQQKGSWRVPLSYQMHRWVDQKTCWPYGVTKDLRQYNLNVDFITPVLWLECWSLAWRNKIEPLRDEAHQKLFAPYIQIASMTSSVIVINDHCHHDQVTLPIQYDSICWYKTHKTLIETTVDLHPNIFLSFYIKKGYWNQSNWTE